jgi:hypothetical protein
MKRILATAILLALTAFSAFGAATTVQVSAEQGFSTVSAGSAINITGKKSVYHRMYWYPFGTVATCTVSLEGSADGSSGWSTIISGQTCTSAGSSTYTAGAANYVRPNLTTFTGGGSLLVVYEGWNGDPAGTTPAANSSVNVSQVAGTTADTNSGSKSAGTLRVVVATDQPSLTNAQPINQTQVNGVTKSTGQGLPDTGTERIFLGQKVTYTAATTAKTATAAGTGPFFAICGSSTKTIRVQYISIGGTVATAAVYGDVELTKTSTATSSGTATALTKVPNDSNSAASTANLLNFYTALATAGSAVGKVGSQTAVFPITGTVAASAGTVLFDWTNRQESEAPVLRGTAQCIEASFGTTTTNAPTLTVAIAYTEE